MYHSDIKTGIYVFYNKALGGYLSYSGQVLTIGSTPTRWKLSRIGKRFLIHPEGSFSLIDIDNAYVAEGTAVKVWQYTGHDAQVWEICENANRTVSFLSAMNTGYCLGFKNRKAELQRRKVGSYLQEWTAASMCDEAFISIYSKAKTVELQMPLNITDVISTPRLQQWANDLEKAYGTYSELTSYKPHESITVEAYSSYAHLGYAGFVLCNSNVIHIDNDFLRSDLAKMAKRENDWNFCVLHEMGHLFDNGMPWDFEAEMMTDLKLAYVLEANAASAAPAEFGVESIFRGKEIINAYERLKRDFSREYDVFGCVHRFLKIKEDIGWAPFKKTFYELKRDCALYSRASRREKFINFTALLSKHGGRDVSVYFSHDEWYSVLNKSDN